MSFIKAVNSTHKKEVKEMLKDEVKVQDKEERYETPNVTTYKEEDMVSSYEAVASLSF